MTELKAICSCGRKATINARFSNGRLVTRGSVIEIGGDERYKAICYECYLKLKKEQNKIQDLLIKYVNTYPIESFFTNDVYNDFCKRNGLDIGIRKFGRELSKLGYVSKSVRIDGKIERIIKRK